MMIMISNNMLNRVVRLDYPRIHRSGFMLSSPDTKYVIFLPQKLVSIVFKGDTIETISLWKMSDIWEVYTIIIFHLALRAFCIFEMIRTIASGIISEFSL